MPPEDPMFNKSTEAYIQESSKDYELEKFDKDSLDEIRKLIKENKYKDPQKLRDHMELVEHMLERLMRIARNEDQQGMMNLSFKRDLAKVKELYEQMSRLLDTLEGN